MDNQDKRQLVADTGRLLLEKGLVARTWGNISARVDKTKFAISPSGLGYVGMKDADVPVYDYETETYVGSRKPSSEKKIHAKAYEIFEDVNCVIHTHQDYATIASLAGGQDMEMTDEERQILGTVKVANYGLPGTKKLKKNVEKAYKEGSKVVLMAHHGAVILGKDMEDAILKAEILETVCQRMIAKKLETYQDADKKELSHEFKSACQDAVIVNEKNVLVRSYQKEFRVMLDDIAQMIGPKLKVVDNDDAKIIAALNKQDAVLVKGVGAVILTEDPDDAKALELLVVKTAMAKNYLDALGIKKPLSWIDCTLMRFVYKKKYSKKKGG